VVLGAFALMPFRGYDPYYNLKFCIVDEQSDLEVRSPNPE